MGIHGISNKQITMHAYTFGLLKSGQKNISPKAVFVKIFSKTQAQIDEHILIECEIFRYLFEY